MRKWIMAVSLGLAATLAFGCARHDGPERAVVFGTVTYNGKPVADGMVYFIPQAASTLPKSGAAIADGKYRADGNGGVPVGTHKVRIEAYRYASQSAAPGLPAPPAKSKTGPRQQYLPAKYNADTMLELTVEPGIRKIAKDFELSDRAGK
jgi:hypothetical protein